MTLGGYPPSGSRFLLYNGGTMPGYATNLARLREQHVTIQSLQSQLDAFDHPALYQPDNYQGRADLIDAIEFEIIDRIDGLLAYPSQPRKLRSLRQSAE